MYRSGLVAFGRRRHILELAWQSIVNCSSSHGVLAQNESLHHVAPHCIAFTHTRGKIMYETCSAATVSALWPQNIAAKNEARFAACDAADTGFCCNCFYFEDYVHSQ